MNAQIFVIFLYMLIPATAPVMSFGQAYRNQQKDMIEHQLKKRGISSPQVLKAMEAMPRHIFVPEDERFRAYADRPLPIGHGQTISQPYTVALMSETLALDPGSKILEIGTGSGYQAAVLAEMGMEVYTIEIVSELAKQAGENLKKAGYTNVNIRVGDGYQGWPEEAPFDGIILTAAPEQIPEKLIDQLKTGGVMVLPVGSEDQTQTLKKIVKTRKGFQEKDLLMVRFVPMVRNEK